MALLPVTSLGVNAVTPVTTYTTPATHKTNESVSSAVNIGDLEQQGVILQVSDQGTTAGTQTYNFTLQQNDNAYLQLSFGNIVDAATTHIQILDSQGNVVADNQGDSSQQYVYNQITTNGYALGAGNYSLQVTPLAGSGAPDVSLGALQQQGTSLAVNSTLTSSDSAEYYNFSLGNSNNLKLAFDAGASTSGVQLQLLDSSGHIVADNRGNAFQKDAFAQLTSSTGLTRDAGNYTVKVTYADPTNTNDIKYNFQLFSGVNYSVVYQTNAAPIPADTSAAGSVKAGSNTQTFGRQAYHTVNETAQTAVGVGWLQQNKTALSVSSLLTPVDSTDYYSFTLQSGDNLKLSLSNLTNKSNTTAVHLQLLDSSGGRVIADNQGTASQKAAFAQLTSSTGLTAKPASYVVKATYGQGAVKSEQLAYNFKIYSGTTYTSLYNTTASAQNYENAVLSGSLGGGYSPFAASASYLNSLSTGSAPDILSTLQTVA